MVVSEERGQGSRAGQARPGGEAAPERVPYQAGAHRRGTGHRGREKTGGRQGRAGEQCGRKEKRTFSKKRARARTAPSVAGEKSRRRRQQGRARGTEDGSDRRAGRSSASARVGDGQRATCVSGQTGRRQGRTAGLARGRERNTNRPHRAGAKKVRRAGAGRGPGRGKWVRRRAANAGQSAAERRGKPEGGTGALGQGGKGVSGRQEARKRKKKAPRARTRGAGRAPRAVHSGERGEGSGSRRVASCRHHGPEGGAGRGVVNVPGSWPVGKTPPEARPRKSAHSRRMHVAQTSGGEW